jgi:hypothetical protein
MVVRSDAKSGVLARPWTPGPAPGGGCIRPTPPRAARAWSRVVGVDVLEELAGSLAFGPLSPAPPPAGSVGGGGGLAAGTGRGCTGRIFPRESEKKKFLFHVRKKNRSQKNVTKNNLSTFDDDGQYSSVINISRC